MKSLIVAVSLVFAAVPAFAQCSVADRKALEDFDRAWGEATERGDRVTMARFIADEFQGFVPGESREKKRTLTWP
jgi:hypothetical protein